MIKLRLIFLFLKWLAVSLRDKKITAEEFEELIDAIEKILGPRLPEPTD